MNSCNWRLGVLAGRWEVLAVWLGVLAGHEQNKSWKRRSSQEERGEPSVNRELLPGERGLSGADGGIGGVSGMHTVWPHMQRCIDRPTGDAEADE